MQVVDTNNTIKMAKKFKKHMMYSKSGKGVMANTMQDHLDLKKKDMVIQNLKR